MLMCSLNQLSSANIWWMKHDLERMNGLRDIVYLDPIWLMLMLPSDQVSHVSITALCHIISDLWLVNLPYYSPLIGRGSQVAWVTVSISRIVISCHSAQLSGGGEPFYCITSISVQILDIFQTLHNVHHFRVRSLVSVSLPASWSSSECARPRGEAGARAGMVSPDLVIVTDDSDDDDSDDSDGGVRALQHLGCGHQGLQVTVSQRMFSPSLSVMEHHRKGELRVVMNYLCHWFNVMLWKSRSSPPTVTLTSQIWLNI